MSRVTSQQYVIYKDNQTYNFSNNWQVASVLNGSLGLTSFIFLANSLICLDSLLYLQERNKLSWSKVMRAKQMLSDSATVSVNNSLL